MGKNNSRNSHPPQYKRNPPSDQAHKCLKECEVLPFLLLFEGWVGSNDMSLPNHCNNKVLDLYIVYCEQLPVLPL